ncbi:Type II secretion system F domain protein [[Leptolyngbya] sp. PCC 7376]|uniref:type II secretion system F family protein n=1 Tax=[Leptolyngbya] sp. PCC 7376 TaxID=111781 RepID=UPI00029ED33E|nr:type II secretion system F family protein [[Leptolyngbya] sp. PCC 7376]AFY39252.1 Type II secretion system F domain protein [[Leptolyngbya] sp. PCC 7376]
MAVYTAQVVDRSGQKVKQKIEANSAEQARTMLEAQYGDVGKVLKQGEIDLGFIEEALSKVTVKDKAVFSRQFAVMINAGVAIVRCLSILGENHSNYKMRKALGAIKTEVQQGVNLSDAMRPHEECFDTLYVSMVEAGEIGGVLDEVLNRLAKVLEDMAKLENQIKSAMTYPLAVAFLAIAVFFGMTVFLIPVFADIFASIGTELPGLTLVMMAISQFLRTNEGLIPIPFGNVIVMFIGLNILFFAVRQYYKTPAGHWQIDALMLKIPLVGDLLQKNAVARFCRIFGTLTRSGVPILSSFDIVGATAGNVVIANSINRAKAEIQEGGMLSVALDRDKVFPILSIQMMTIGEETGELDSMMMKVADFYEDEVEQTVKAMTSILEPVMMVVIAGMVGVILLSMYLPMFKVFETLG